MSEIQTQIEQLLLINQIKTNYLTTIKILNKPICQQIILFLRQYEVAIENLSEHPKILNLQNCHLNDEYLKIFFQSYKYHKDILQSVTEINLNSNKLSDMTLILEIIQNFNNLKEINLCENTFDSTKLQEIKNKLKIINVVTQKKIVFKQINQLKNSTINTKSPIKKPQDSSPIKNIFYNIQQNTPIKNLDQSPIKQKQIQDKNEIRKQINRIDWLLELKKLFDESKEIQLKSFIKIIEIKKQNFNLINSDLNFDQILIYLSKLKIDKISFEDVQDFFQNNQDIESKFIQKKKRSYSINLFNNKMNPEEENNKETARFNQQFQEKSVDQLSNISLMEKNNISISEFDQSLQETDRSINQLIFQQKNDLSPKISISSQNKTLETSEFIIDQQKELQPIPFSTPLKSSQNQNLQSIKKSPIKQVYIDLSLKSPLKETQKKKEKISPNNNKNQDECSTSRSSHKSSSGRAKINYSDFKQVIQRFEKQKQVIEKDLFYQTLNQMEVNDNLLAIQYFNLNFNQNQSTCWHSQLFKDLFRLNQIFKVTQSPEIIGNIPEFNQIIILNLSFNKIQNLNFLQKVYFQQQCASVQFLNLGYNHLTSIEGVYNCKKLKELNVENNIISQLTGIESLKRLTYLNLKENLIENHDQILILKKCENLKYIWLKGNQLSLQEKYIEKIQFYLPQIQEFDQDLIMVYNFNQEKNRKYQKLDKFIFCLKDEIDKYKAQTSDLYSSVDSFDLYQEEKFIKSRDNSYSKN